MHDVFISYKSTQYDIADKVRRHLEDAGILCWIAPDHIEGGQSYARQIPNAIRNAKVFVVLISRSAMDSVWVSKELDNAINEGKRIMPFVLEDVPLSDEFGFYLANIQRYHASKDFEGQLEHMTDDILLYLGKERPARKGPAEAAVFDTETASVPEQKQETANAQDPEPPQRAQEQEQPRSEQKPEKPKREAKPQKPKREHKPGKPKKKLWLIPLIAIPVLSVLIAVIAATGSGRSGKAAPTPTPKIEKLEGQNLDLAQFLKSGDTLEIKDCTLSEADVQAIGLMDALSTVTLKNCTIACEDLSALIGANTRVLTLSNCALSAEQVQTLPLAGSEIRILDLSGNPIGDVVLTLPENLSALDISDTGMSDRITAGVYSLRELHMEGNGLTSLAALSDMKELRSLFIGRNKLDNLDDLKQCISIKTLIANGNQLTSIASIGNMSRLELVDLSGNQITDISPLLTSARTIEKLDLSGNTPDLSAFREVVFEKLTDLYLNSCQLESIPFTWGKCTPALKVLYMNDNPEMGGYLPDLPLKKLYAADCGYNGFVSEFKPDENAKYVELVLRGNAIDGIRFADVDCSYNVLDLRDFVPNQEYAARIAKLHGNVIAIGYSDVLDLQALRSNWISIYLVACPLNKELDVKDVLGYRVKFYEKSTDLPEDLN